MNKNVKQVKIPNCAKCKWYIKEVFATTCKAQGNKSTIINYNTKECKELYEEK